MLSLTVLIKEYGNQEGLNWEEEGKEDSRQSKPWRLAGKSPERT